MRKANIKSIYKIKGFSLIELLLIMVIITVVIMSSTLYLTQQTENMRIDKTVHQMQYILNAGMAYYVANGRWPDPPGYTPLSSGAASELQPDFLPATPIPTQFAGPVPYYFIGHVLYATTYVPANTFHVVIYIGVDTPEKRARARKIAARLPHGYFDNTIGFVYSVVEIPGQNLNSATAFNFVGLYHHGACVPVPSCPAMTAADGVTSSPQIFVTPVSVSGANDSSPNQDNVYPISSFTAFSTKMSDENDIPDACPGNFVTRSCDPVTGTPESHRYWRVCLQVVTEKGDVQVTRRDEWGNKVTVAAFTRCNISNEPAGSDFSVYTH